MGMKLCVILRVEHRLRAFGNRFLRKIFGPNRGEVTGGWRKLLNEELCDLYSLPVGTIKSWKMRWTGYIAQMREKRNTCEFLVEKPEGNGPLGRPRCRWVNNIKMDLVELGWGDVE
jgi:hypothetical protein